MLVFRWALEVPAITEQPLKISEMRELGNRFDNGFAKVLPEPDVRLLWCFRKPIESPSVAAYVIGWKYGSRNFAGHGELTVRDGFSSMPVSN